MPLPDAAAWDALTKIGVAVTFLGMVVGALWKLGIVRKPRVDATPGPKKDAEMSPEVRALIEATHTLVKATEAIATRSEALGRIHQRLDRVDEDIGGVKTQNARLEGKLDQQGRLLELIHRHLLEK